MALVKSEDWSNKGAAILNIGFVGYYMIDKLLVEYKTEKVNYQQAIKNLTSKSYISYTSMYKNKLKRFLSKQKLLILNKIWQTALNIANHKIFMANCTK